MAKIMGYVVYILLACFLIWPESATAQLPAHQSAEQGGFTVIALLTSDLDWQEKWDTPEDVIPDFETASSLSLGDEAILLVLYAGVATEAGAVQLECDLTIRKPDGTTQSVAAAPCASGVREGLASNLRMTGLQVRIVAEPKDPMGLYTFEVGLTDVVQNLRVSVTVGLEMRIGESEQ